MLHLLPAEVTLSVLSHLPVPLLLSLSVLSREWFHFFTANESKIFHRAAILHEYIKPETLLLEDALSVNTGRPWEGSSSWKDFCCRSIQLRKNWEGKGRAVARMLVSSSNPRCIKVDEKAGISITIGPWDCINVTHLFSGTSLWCLPKSHVRSGSPCEYDNGYLVFDNKDGNKEVWRLARDFAAEDEVAANSPPNDEQMAASAYAAEDYHHYAPRGQFRPWALLRPPKSADAYRLVYPVLICVNHEHAFLYDVRTGSLVQTVYLNLQTISDVDMNERHVSVCEQDVVHVFSLESGSEVLRIPADAIVRCTSQRVEDPFLIAGDWFITPLSVSAEVDECPRLKLIAVKVSRDGRDLVILSKEGRVIFIRDFERICRGETTFEQVALVLGIPPEDECRCLGFEHGRVCVATVQGLYIFTFDPVISAKAVFVRPSGKPEVGSFQMSCMQLTDRRIYFSWGKLMRRRDIPLFEDPENAQELPSPPKTIPSTTQLLNMKTMRFLAHHGAYGVTSSLGCIDFSLMPEGYGGEI